MTSTRNAEVGRAGRPPVNGRTRRGRTLAFGALLAIGSTGSICAAPPQAPADGTPRAAGDGRALFEGSAPLAGRLAGHERDLPAAATRCINCHRRDTAPPGSSGNDTRSYGPRLDAQALVAPRPRRGGPPSRYDAAALCRLLRDGVDPAWVLIDRAMPRYRASDAECEVLWRFLAAGGAS